MLTAHLHVSEHTDQHCVAIPDHRCDRYPTFGDGAISDRNLEVEESSDGADTVSYLRGNHEFKAGFELIRAFL